MNLDMKSSKVMKAAVQAEERLFYNLFSLVIKHGINGSSEFMG